MKNKLVLLSLLIHICGFSQVRSFTSESAASFELKSLTFKTVTGTMGNPTGFATYDDGILVAIQGCLDANTVDTGSKGRDESLREEKEFFNTAKTPLVCFKASSVIFVGKSSGLTTYKLAGNLTLRGLSKPLQLELVEQNNGILTGTFTIDRELWGLGEGYPNFTISQNIEVQVDIHLQ